MKKIIFSLILLCVSATLSYAQLNAGDIVIVEFNSDNPDDLQFLALTDIANGEVIYFTDNGWFSSGSWRTGEGTHMDINRC